MLRWLGRLLILVGLVILAADAAAWMGGGDERLSALGEWWFWLHKDSLQVLQPAIERHISPALWDPGIQTLLEWPAAIEFLLLGMFLIALSRLFRREPAEGGDAKA